MPFGGGMNPRLSVNTEYFDCGANTVGSSKVPAIMIMLPGRAIDWTNTPIRSLGRSVDEESTRAAGHVEGLQVALYADELGWEAHSREEGRTGEMLAITTVANKAACRFSSDGVANLPAKAASGVSIFCVNEPPGH